jgi:hypothetical protein
MNALHGIAALGAAIALGSVARPLTRAQKVALGQIVKTRADYIIFEWPRGSESLTNAGVTKEQAFLQLRAWLDKLPGDSPLFPRP